MEAILKISPVFEVGLGLVLVLCFFILMFLVSALCIKKRKLSSYIDQIKITGTIEPISDTNLLFEFGIILWAFEKLPAVKNNPVYNKYKSLVQLEGDIKALTKALQTIAIILGTIVVILVLVNWLGS